MILSLLLASALLTSNFIITETPDVEVANYARSELRTMLENNTGTAVESLINQLSRTSCYLNLPPVKTKELTSSELYQENLPATFILASLYKCSSCTKWHLSTASGFFINPDGVAVSSCHVFTKDKSAYAVISYDGSIYPVKEILAANKINDIVIFKIEANNLNTLPLSAKTTLVGDKIALIHNPANNFFMYSEGIVNRSVLRKINNSNVNLIQISAPFARGSSGAAVLDRSGNVVSLARDTISIKTLAKERAERAHQMTIYETVPAQEILKLINPQKNQKSWWNFWRK